MQHILYRLFTITLLVLAFIAASDARATQTAVQSYPALFGTHEIYSPAIDRFYKWTGMLQRWSAERREATRPCTLGQITACEPREWRGPLGFLTPPPLRAQNDAAN